MVRWKTSRGVYGLGKTRTDLVLIRFIQGEGVSVIRQRVR